MKDKLNRLFLYGAMGLIAGFLLQDVCPLNKKGVVAYICVGYLRFFCSSFVYSAVVYRCDEEISEDLDFCHIWCKSVVLLCT